MNIPLIKVATTKTDLSHMYFWLAYKPFWFSCSLMSDSLWRHILQHTRLPHPLLFAEICSNSCPLSQLCHPTISSFTILFFCPQSFPASGSFPVGNKDSYHQEQVMKLDNTFDSALSAFHITDSNLSITTQRDVGIPILQMSKLSLREIK